MHFFFIQFLFSLSLCSPSCLVRLSFLCLIYEMYANWNVYARNFKQCVLRICSSTWNNRMEFFGTTKKKPTKFKQKYYWKILNDEKNKSRNIVIDLVSRILISYPFSHRTMHFRFVAVAAPQLQYLFRRQSAVWDYLCAEYALLCCCAAVLLCWHKPCPIYKDHQCVCKLPLNSRIFIRRFGFVFFFFRRKRINNPNNEHSQQLR